MITSGTYTNVKGKFDCIIYHSKRKTEICISQNGTVVSAYKVDGADQYGYINNTAKEAYELLNKGFRGCKKEIGTPIMFELGAAISYEFIQSKVEYQIIKHQNEMCGAVITANGQILNVYYDTNAVIPEIPYVTITKVGEKISNLSEDEISAIPVRTVEEIALEKEDVTWLNNKNYYVIQDEQVAEQIFSYLENYNGIIALDYETTGLKINCFGKIGSEYSEQLEKYNSEHPEEQIKVDRLCGLIFCVEPNVSYYFPCFSRKYNVLYEDRESAERKRLINNIKSRYTVGDKRNEISDIAKYVRNTKEEDFREDVILMERCRDILTTKHIGTHGGSFEYKVGLLFDIDTNIKDDSMILHQIMYKFNSNVSGKGEPSNLKFLSKKDLGIDQWSLKDFFPSIKEDNTGKVREKGKSKNRIDFSYMDLKGTKVYAPTDGDCTLQLIFMYKSDLYEKHKEQLYLYSFEMIVLLAIGYMEFYGHRLDENKILGTRDDTKANIMKIESEIRQLIGYCSEKEKSAYNEMIRIIEHKKELEKSDGSDEEKQKKINEASARLVEKVEEIKKIISEDTEHILNLDSPSQVADLFYNKLNIPLRADKKSVAKQALKPLLREKNEDGSDKYPVVHMYSKYKAEITLLTKFFDNLPNFMYPGGFIFSSYGQIATTTGRMSCSKPNAQQYPKSITKIVTARKGCVHCDADYSQIEYRVLTGMAGNQYLLKLFSDPDSDYHTLMASLMYDVPYASVLPSMRSAAKSFNFGIPYGMGMKSLAILLCGNASPQSVADAEEKYELYFKNQPETKKLFDRIKETAQVNKYTKTMWNRYRRYNFEGKDGRIDERKKSAVLREAGNAVIQGTAADIFKISVARNFLYIRENNLFGKFFIINMIHDEQLMEIDARYLNVQRVLRDVGQNMQFEVNGLPPLYIGAGVAKTWAVAKDKMAEIHPDLLAQLSKEAESMPIFRETPLMDINTNEVVEYFDRRNYEFRKKKIIDYLTDENNINADIHPAIGSLINLQFNYGRKESGMSSDEFLRANLEDFIRENNLDVNTSMFKANMIKEEEEDKEYDDDEELVEAIEDYETRSFRVVEEEDSLYGVTLQDIISEFGTCIVKHMGVCGVRVKGLSRRGLDTVCNYLAKYACDKEDGALQVVMLSETNVLTYTGIFVKDLDSDDFENMYQQMSNPEVRYGDIETRAVR